MNIDLGELLVVVNFALENYNEKLIKNSEITL